MERSTLRGDLYGAPNREPEAIRLRAGGVLTKSVLATTVVLMEQVDARNIEVDADGFAPIREATTDDVDALFAMRQDREKWFAARGIQQWEIGSLASEQIHSQVQAGQWWLMTKRDAGAAAAMRIIWSDPEFWDDRPGTGIYVHGLMVALPFAGMGLGRRMLDFARALGVAEGVSFFRLDCVADNAPLTQIYRDYGFDHVGQKDFPNVSVALMEITLDDRARAADRAHATSHGAACD